MISQFGFVLLFFVSGMLLVLLMLGIAKLLRPNNPNEQKNDTYESGELSSGPALVSFNLRFYIVALVFILFDVELVLLFPWATIFGDEKLVAESNNAWLLYSGIEMAIFIFILALGLAYVWSKGHLEWINKGVPFENEKSIVPDKYYDKVNEKYSKIK